jgi:glucose-6-phosphate dehydrogenase assembly protein OpcA
VIVLRPDPDADADRVDAHVALECFDLPELEAGVSAEVIELRLLGRLCVAPASVIAPLLMADLPVFMRWRGRPPFSGETFEQLVGVIDRLVVDSVEWPDVPEAYAELARTFDRVACSDIAWRRTQRWRAALAGLWPEIAEVSELKVTGPASEAFLLAGWLRSRLGREVELDSDHAVTVGEVYADGQPAVPAYEDAATPSDLLSAELDVLERDRVYEAAAEAAAELAPLAA